MKEDYITTHSTIEQLKKEVDIPEIVKNRADETFNKIKNENSEVIQMPNKKLFRRMNKAAACAVIGILTCGVISVGATAYYKWNKGLEEYYQVKEEDKTKIEESGLADFPDLSVTNQGVTVTLEESIVDNYYAYVTLKVEGYDVPEGMQPEFDICEYTIGDYEATGCGMGFYDGTIMGEDGKGKMADGSEIPVDENGISKTDYTMEDGSLSYHLVFSSDGEKGYFFDQPIHLELRNLGYYGDKESVTVGVEGTWSFDWTLTGSDETRVVNCDEALGESGASLIYAEVSPISICAKLDFPYQETVEMGEDENGNPIEHKTYENPPYLTGVKLKDGTMYTRLMGGGMSGYPEDNETFLYLYQTNRILNPEEVESLLFIKSAPEGEGGILTEENLYEVKIN